MNRVKQLITGFYEGKNLKKQLPVTLLGVFFMAFSMSFLVLVDWGTDTFTNMNIAISHLLGMSLGNWQALLNTVLFIIVILSGFDGIGFGTLANMILIGYLLDFFAFLWGIIIPTGLFDLIAVKIIVMAIALPVFVFAAAIYMKAGLGMSPCDATPFIVQEKLEKLLGKTIPFKAVRIGWDITMLIIAFAITGKIYIVTVLMSFMLGPIIEYVGEHINKWFSLD